MDDQIGPSFVYINHYELFTSENLKAFENGDRFDFKYHHEVQRFYNCPDEKAVKQHQFGGCPSLSKSSRSRESRISTPSTSSSSRLSTTSSVRPKCSRSKIEHCPSSPPPSRVINHNSSDGSSARSSFVKRRFKDIPSKPERERFLDEIRQFKFPANLKTPPKPPPVFKLNSNPLLTSEHLHREIDRVRQQLNGSTADEESDRDSCAQWGLV